MNHKGILQDNRLHFMSFDYFESSVHDCSLFFLSHAHSDHLNGISSTEFVNRFNTDKEKRIYCSEITKKVFANRPNFNLDTRKIYTLEIGQPETVADPTNSMLVTVTTLPAAHCPGSVMFLVEYDQKRLIFTGDIRLTLSEIKAMKSLTNPNGSAKTINEIYLDTTFASKEYEHFPARDKSVEIIIKLAREWKKLDAFNNIVHLNHPGRIGFEYIYEMLFGEFRKPVYVHEDIYQECYSYIVQMDKWVTNRPEGCFIHACHRKKCPFISAKNSEVVRTIKPCAMAFTQIQDANMCAREYGWKSKTGEFYRVCYSSHCSLCELKDIVQFLNPEKVIPIAFMDNMTSEKVVDLVRS